MKMQKNPKSIFHVRYVVTIFIFYFLSTAEGRFSKGPGNTALHCAVFKEKFDLAKALIKQGADVNIGAGKDKFTPLQVASFVGNKEMAQLLIENGAVVDMRDSRGMTALHYAAVTGQLELTKLLVSLGADIFSKDTIDGKKPAHLAAQVSKDLLEFYLDHGIDVNERDDNDETLLHYAVMPLKTVVIDLLRDLQKSCFV